MNSSKQGVTAVDRPGHGSAPGVTVEVDVHGRYVIQLSNKMDVVHVRRALAHEVAEILARRALGGALPGGDVLRTGSDVNAPLSPHDRGRIAEVNELALLAMKPHESARAQHELIALVEDMGLRAGTPGADERFERMAPELTNRGREALRRARVEERQLPEADQKRLAWTREEAAADRAAQQELAESKRPLHEMPTSGIKGRIATQSERIALAEQARTKRDNRSARTLVELRAQNAMGVRPKMRVQIGGNASLAARDPHALLIDANDRWAVDASPELAQTAQQLEGLTAAGIGNPYQFAAADERVPIEAVRFWQDEIAAQGPLVDGWGELVLEGETLVVKVQPRDDRHPCSSKSSGCRSSRRDSRRRTHPGHRGTAAEERCRRVRRSVKSRPRWASSRKTHPSGRRRPLRARSSPSSKGSTSQRPRALWTHSAVSFAEGSPL